MRRCAVIAGWLSAVALASLSFYNLYILQNTNLVGSYLPVGLFAGAIVLAGVVHPLMRRMLGDRWGWSAADLAGLLGLSMFACGVVGSALLDHATTLMMMPHHLDRTQSAWRGDPVMPEAREVLDWARLRERLLGEDEADRVSRSLRERIRAAHAADRGQEQTVALSASDSELIETLRETVGDPTWWRGIDEAERLPVPQYVRRWMLLPDNRRSIEQNLAINRAILDASFSGLLMPRRPRVLDLAPTCMLADPQEDPEALRQFVLGVPHAGSEQGNLRVPWRAWRRALTYWGTAVAAMVALMIGLSLVVHRQWSHHEHLPYPTIQILHAILPEGTGTSGSVLRQRLFWFGFAPVFGLHLLNYAHHWWPNTVIHCPLTVDLRPFLEVIPLLRTHFAGPLFQPTFYVTAFGLAYFLASDVGLALGIGPYLYALVAGLLARRGIPVGGGFLRINLQSQIQAGSYTAMFLVLLYSGRRYFGSVARGILGWHTVDSVDREAVLGGRVALAGAAALVLVLVWAGAEPTLAVLWVAVAAMTLVVMSRLLAEAGVFYLHPVFFPCVVLWGFLGARAIGYEQPLILGLASAMFMSDPKDALMPFVVTALHLAERAGLRPSALALRGAIAVVLSIIVAVPVVLHLQYRHGAIRAGHPWMWRQVPGATFDRAAHMVDVLRAQGALQATHAIGGWSRLTEARVRREVWGPFVVSFALVVGFSILRRRVARWPLHPLMFLVMTTYQSSLMAFSFLIGWAFKAIVMKYGGGLTYQRLKPFVIGSVLGEISAAAVPLIVGLVYAQVTGVPAPAYRILPG